MKGKKVDEKKSVILIWNLFIIIKKLPNELTNFIYKVYNIWVCKSLVILNNIQIINWRSK